MIVSCSFGTKGVYFNEMSKKPSIEIFDGRIVVTTDNSSQNSALLIYKVDYTVDTSEKIIELKAYQALNKKYKNTFNIHLPSIRKTNLNYYKYFWIDPDGTKNQIEEIKK
jgi:hypothetical protein